MLALQWMKRACAARKPPLPLLHPACPPRSVCVIAGDISPIDVVTPLPVLCEDHDVPYIYVPSKEELGAAGLTKRPTSCMLILPKPPKGGASDDAEAQEFKEAYAEVRAGRGWVWRGRWRGGASVGARLGATPCWGAC